MYLLPLCKPARRCLVVVHRRIEGGLAHMTESTLTTESTLMDLSGHYSAAWAYHDTNAILALHSEDSVFQVHGGGLKATGLSEIRTALDTFFATWTQARFEPRGVLFGKGHFVAEWTLLAAIVSPTDVQG